LAYSDKLARRVRDALKGGMDLREQKMFGGIAFMLRGNMCCGVLGDDLIVRVGPEAYRKALARKHAREFDFTGKPLCGIVRVVADGTRSAAALGGWVGQGVRFARSLRPK